MYTEPHSPNPVPDRTESRPRTKREERRHRRRQWRIYYLAGVVVFTLVICLKETFSPRPTKEAAPQEQLIDEDLLRQIDEVTTVMDSLIATLDSLHTEPYKQI